MSEEESLKENEDRHSKIYTDALLLAGDPLSVCDEIVTWISELIQVEFSFIEKIEGDEFVVISSIQNGELIHSGEYPMVGSPCEKVLTLKAPCAFEDVAKEFPNDQFLLDHGVKFYTGVPIFSHDGSVIGVLNAFGSQVREIAESDQNLMELMAKRASLELEHMSLQETSHRLQQNLLEIGKEILQQQNVEEILRRVADGIQTHSPFELVAITLYQAPIEVANPTSERIAHIVLGGLSEEDQTRLMELAASGEFIPAREILARGRKIGGGYYVSPDLIPELEKTSIKGSTFDTGAQGWGPYDDFYIFLQSGDRIIGRISLGDPVSGKLPAEDELEPLNLFANLATLALDKAHRLEELETFQTRLQGIYAWNDQLAKCEDLEEMSTVAMQVMIEMFQYDHVSLFRNEGADLNLMAFETKLPIAEYELERFQSIRKGEGIVGHVAEIRKPYICSDVMSDSRYLPGHQGIRSEMAAPIIDSGELFGVLNIESVHLDSFGQEDLKLLTALASQLALIIRGIERREDVEWINRFLQGLNRSSYLQDTLELIIQRGIEILSPKANAGSFLLWNENSQIFEFAAAVNRDLEELKAVCIPMHGLVSEIFDSRQPIILTKNAQSESGISSVFVDVDSAPPASTIALPVRDEEQVVAVLCINNLSEENIFTERDSERIWDLISEIELALARARDHEKLRQMAMHDALTNTYNRHFFSEYVDAERQEELLNEAPISLVMVDIDDFYQVNDRFGHAEGDRTLQRVAELIRKEVRKNDMVVRYGGDEFIIIMPETTEAQALNVMERLKSKFEEWQPDLPELNLSISFGVSSWDPNENDSLLDVVEKADQFMYHRRQERVIDRRARKQAIIGGQQSSTD